MGNNNVDINNLINMLSKMDKSQLEAGIKKANEILKNGNKNDIINTINKNK